MAKKIDVNGLDHYHDKVSAMLASEYSSSKTYAVGDYCFHAGTLYECTTAITTAENWTSGHWTAAKLAEDTSALKTALDDVENEIFDRTETTLTERNIGRNCAIASNGVYFSNSSNRLFSFNVIGYDKIDVNSVLNGFESGERCAVAFYSFPYDNVPSPSNVTTDDVVGVGSVYNATSYPAVVGGYNIHETLSVPTGAKSMLVMFPVVMVDNVSTYLIVKGIKESSHIDALSDDVNSLETKEADLEYYIGESEVFSFKEDSGYALNYSTTMKYASFKVKVDKITGNHTTFSIRVKQGSGTATTIYSGCEFGKDYKVNTDLTQYDTLLIYQAAPASHPTAYGSTSYKLTIIGTNTLNGRLYQLETNPTVLAGKKILMLGDSITQLPITGNYIGKGIVEYVSEMTGATCIRGAIGGSEMQGGDPLPELPITNINDAKTALNVVYIAKALADGDLSVQQAAAQYVYDNGGDTAWKSIIDNLAELDMTKIDAVTLFAGTNDFSSSLYLGDENDDTDFTYCGAINNIVNALCTAYPQLTIFVFTPIVRHFVDSKTESTAADFSDTYTNARGDKLTDYVEGAKATALKNHIPCLDLYNEMGWNVYNFWQYFPSNDGCHPRNSFDKIAALISAFMVSHWNR